VFGESLQYSCTTSAWIRLCLVGICSLTVSHHSLCHTLANYAYFIQSSPFVIYRTCLCHSRFRNKSDHIPQRGRWRLILSGKNEVDSQMWPWGLKIPTKEYNKESTNSGTLYLLPIVYVSIVKAWLTSFGGVTNKMIVKFIGLNEGYCLSI